MKRNFVLSLLSLVLIMAVLALPAQASETKAAFTAGVIDMTRVMRETEAAKGILSEMDKKRKEFEKQIQAEGDKLGKLEQDIVSRREKMNEGEFEKSKKDFEEKIVAAHKMTQEHRQTLDRAFNEAIGRLRMEATKITADIAKERGYTMVLTQEAIILAEPSYDLTDEVVKQLNSKVKKIAVKW